MRTRESLDLSPAEALYLIKTDSEHPVRQFAPAHAFMKHTLLDLLFREVVRIEMHNVEEGRWFEQSTPQRCVAPGPHFKTATLKLHERLMADAVRPDLPVRTYAGAIAPSGPTFMVLVRQALVAKGYVTIRQQKRLFVVPVRRACLTPEGADAKLALDEALADGRANLDEWLRSDPAEARRYIRSVGTNVLLIADGNTPRAQEWIAAAQALGLEGDVARLHPRFNPTIDADFDEAFAE